MQGHHSCVRSSSVSEQQLIIIAVTSRPAHVPTESSDRVRWGLDLDSPAPVHIEPPLAVSLHARPSLLRTQFVRERTTNNHISRHVPTSRRPPPKRHPTTCEKESSE